MRSRILFVSGRHDDVRRLSRMLDTLPIDFDHVDGIRQARAKLLSSEYEVILTEASLTDGNWLDALHLARDCSHDIQVVVTDPQGDIHFWAQALNMGAYDVLAQPFYEPEVRRILYNACLPAARAEAVMTA